MCSFQNSLLQLSLPTQNAVPESASREAMAEANCISSTSGGDSRKTNVTGDVCRDLKGLQQGQAQLVKQMEKFTLTLNALLGVQKGLNTQIAALAGRCREQRATGPCNMPSEEPKAVADVESSTVPTAPYLQSDAGRRLMNTSELLKMILLELPSEDILSAQRISRQVCSVIARSHPLQLRLFLATQPATSVSKNIILILS